MSRTARTLAEGANYLIRVGKAKSTFTLSGVDKVYEVVNKETRVVEGRAATLPDALGWMRGIQFAYETATRDSTAVPEIPLSEDTAIEPAEH